MENNSIFWNNISEWLKQMGLPYITQTEAILIILAVSLILLVLLWFIFRRARLWYWKKNIEIDTLKSIDIHLKNVEEKLSVDAIKIVEKPNELQAQNDEGAPQEQAANRETVQEINGPTAIGKSGRVYTQAELELLIRD